jgi:LTXXQ motif family protein
MWKPSLFMIAAVVVGGSSNVYAQEREYDGGDRFEHHRLSPEDRAAFVDAGIAALKAGLELTPDQAKNWPMFEQALRDMAQLRAQLRADREARKQNPTPSTPFERMTGRADNLAKLSAALKHIADTGTPLYQSLNNAQKERFQKLARVLRPHHRHAWDGGGLRRLEQRDGGD